MKRTMLALATSACLVAPAFASPQLDRTTFDFGRINDTIRDALGSVVSLDSDFRKVKFEIDPAKTDIDAGRFGTLMELAGDAPWSKDGFDTTLSLATKSKGDEGRSGSRLSELEFDSTTKTDVLAMLRLIASKSKDCEPSDSQTGFMRVAMKEDCKILPALAEIKSIDSLFELLQTHLKDKGEALKTYARAAAVAAAASDDDSLRHTLKAEALKAKALAAAIEAAKLERTADGISLEIDDISFADVIKAKKLRMELSESSIRMAGELDVKLSTKLKLYDLAKPEIIEVLRNLESGDEFGKKLIKLEAKFWLRAIKAGLTSLE